jgi:hypothetical protein
MSAIGFGGKADGVAGNQLRLNGAAPGRRTVRSGKQKLTIILGHEDSAGGRGHRLFACLAPAALHTFDGDRPVDGFGAFRLTIWPIRFRLSALAAHTNLHPETATAHSPT